MLRRWDVFNHYNGQNRWQVPFKFMARLLARTDPYLDYARKGEGWL